MRIPWVGLGSAVAAALGLFGLYWYDNLSREEKEEADRMAEEYAKNLYGRAVDQLTASQLTRVRELVKGNFAA